MSMSRGYTVSLCAVLVLGAACHSGEQGPKSAGVPSARPGGPEATDGAGGPILRLPQDARPLRYRAALEIDPSAVSFRGRIEIDVDVRRALDQIWLNAHGLTVEKASLRRGGSDTALA